MDIKDSLLQLADKIRKQKGAIQTEEATKNAFIMPMIAMLGYDVFDPFEVIPEMDCDLTQRGDKIDYAIMKDGDPILRCFKCPFWCTYKWHRIQILRRPQQKKYHG